MTVYFARRIGTEGPVKIGHSSDVAARVIGLNTGNPEGIEVICTCVGGRELEDYFHTAFQADRISGEWFTFSHDLRQMVDLLTKVGEAALPAGALGAAKRASRQDGGRATDIELAARLIRRVVEPVPAGLIIGGQIQLAARRLGWGSRRAFCVWYREARVIAAYEMRQLHEAANERWVESHSAEAIQSIITRLEKLERPVVAGDAGQ